MVYVMMPDKRQYEVTDNMPFLNFKLLPTVRTEKGRLYEEWYKTVSEFRIQYIAFIDGVNSNVWAPFSHLDSTL